MMLACNKGFVDIVKLMLTYPMFRDRINQRSGPDLSTPLIYANGGSPENEEVVLALLREPSINVNVQNWDGNTLLHDAMLCYPT